MFSCCGSSQYWLKIISGKNPYGMCLQLEGAANLRFFSQKSLKATSAFMCFIWVVWSQRSVHRCVCKKTDFLFYFPLKFLLRKP